MVSTRSGRLIKKPKFYEPEETVEDDFSDSDYNSDDTGGSDCESIVTEDAEEDDGSDLEGFIVGDDEEEINEASLDEEEEDFDENFEDEESLTEPDLDDEDDD